MKLTRQQLEQAVSRQVISRQQADDLIAFLKQQPVTGPVFDFTHLLYYLGGMIAIGAMSLFMNLGWEAFGGWGIVGISLAYALAGFTLMGIFQQKGHGIPAGICAVFVVVLVPLSIYGLQLALGYWPEGKIYLQYHGDLHWHWLSMEMGALTAGTVMLWRYRYPFLVMPLAVTLWLLLMDVMAMLAGDRFDGEMSALVSMWGGLAMVLVALWVDMRIRQTADYAFWLYLFGIMAFWVGMTLQDSNSEIGKFLYCCINLVLMVVGVTLIRRVFVVFGALGVSLYLGHLAFSVFRDSWFFPVALTAIGLLVISLGIFWQKYEQVASVKLRAKLPTPLKELLESKLTT
ncbi:DUF2157 domain-containing protein [Kistimonas asteriae]|uniref:DUF2157 domain-containing protein n=1 Tax=Kistimonas asteriae TaxID=517724 RepID=UPI001BA72EE9|nr:DUF2157 domain-containing protein [Kistimonas asteriae]